MKHYLQVAYLFFLIVSFSCAKKSYEIVGNNTFDDILYAPNTTSLFKEDNKEIKNKNKFQYIYFENLTKGNYYTVLNSLNQAKYFSSRYDFQGLIENKDYEKVIKSGTSSWGKDCLKIIYSKDKDKLLLQLDYHSLFKSNQIKDAIESRFFEIAKDLLIEFSSNEDKWPTSISQNIVEKIFELIPLPQEASLARYMLDVNDSFSFVLLNPKIWIMVDHTERSMARFSGGQIDASNWQMNYYGQSLIRFYRNNDGYIRQTPFIETTKGQRSNKPLGNIKNSTLFSSSIDMQITEGTKKKKHIGIYQYSEVRGNNSNDIDTPHLIDNVNRNSQLLFMDNLDNNFFNSLARENPAEKADSGIIAATYGMRNIITPVIQIYVNGQSLTVPLNSSYGTIVQIGIIPSIDGIKLYRQGYRGYKRVKGPLTKLKLLPNDKITF